MRKNGPHTFAHSYTHTRTCIHTATLKCNRKYYSMVVSLSSVSWYPVVSQKWSREGACLLSVHCSGETSKISRSVLQLVIYTLIISSYKGFICVYCVDLSGDVPLYSVQEHPPLLEVLHYTTLTWYHDQNTMFNFYPELLNHLLVWQTDQQTKPCNSFTPPLNMYTPIDTCAEEATVIICSVYTCAYKNTLPY